MKASELIERLAKCINYNGDANVYVWNNDLMKHILINDIYFVDDEHFDQDLDDEEYTKDFHNIYHNIVIN